MHMHWWVCSCGFIAFDLWSVSPCPLCGCIGCMLQCILYNWKYIDMLEGSRRGRGRGRRMRRERGRRRSRGWRMEGEEEEEH